MPNPARREFVRGVAAAAIAGGLWGRGFARGADVVVRKPNPRDVRIERVTHAFEELEYRTPLKFARAVVNRQTMLTVTCTVRTAGGREATGFGTLPLNYVFTFPSERLSEAERLG